ncbi:hypothetical protein CBR_g40554 [Chara braunii]|uniref:Uncharacterized protein n=1 Tax=Chara braunii TaxID=69332 RepID=A0A388K237_CHABU|nr:hypothetical protein CBR_g40554 [Chara braunii]|eukprot:GBG64106.1 hypothetical protein CBR_g40554 [Chara braunii]
MVTSPSGRRTWRREKFECDDFLHLKYTSRVMEPLSVRRLVNEVLSRVIGDDTASWLQRTRIGWTYNANISSKLCRPAEVFCEFDLSQWMDSDDPEQCPCRTRTYSDMRSNWSIELLRYEGCTHVITLDSSITDKPLLQGIINAGLNHIPLMALDVEEAIVELDRFLDNLFASVMELRELTESSKSFLRRIIVKKGRARMGKFKAAHKHAVAEPFEHPTFKRELDFITGRFLICLTDKAPNTPTFVCKNFIRKLAFQRLSGPEFACIGMPPSAVISWITLCSVGASSRTCCAPISHDSAEGAKGHLQVKGIPMGLACSPIWCGIYFFKYEFHAMMRLVDTGNAHLIPYFESTFRYIDDLGAINNAVISSFLRQSGDRDPNDPCWVYPDQFIEIKENTEVHEDGIGYVANFLSMTITVTSPIEGTYITSQFDKRTDLGFSPCRFMKFKSNRSIKQSLQIITTQVAQILMICSDPESAANEIAKIVPAMMENGFAAGACWRVGKKTLRNAHLYQPSSLSVHVIREALTNIYGIVD